MDQQSEQRSCVCYPSPNVTRPNYCKRGSTSLHIAQSPSLHNITFKDTICNHMDPYARFPDTALNPVSMDMLHCFQPYGLDAQLKHGDEHAQVDDARVAERTVTPCGKSNRGPASSSPFMPLSESGEQRSTFTTQDNYAAPSWASAYSSAIISGYDTPSSTGSRTWTQATTPNTTFTDNFDLAQPPYGVSATVFAPATAPGLAHAQVPVDDLANFNLWEQNYIPDLCGANAELERYVQHLPPQTTSPHMVTSNDFQAGMQNAQQPVVWHHQPNNRFQERTTSDIVNNRTLSYPALPDLSPCDLFDNFTAQPWHGYVDSSSLTDPNIARSGRDVSSHQPHTVQAVPEAFGPACNHMRPVTRGMPAQAKVEVRQDSLTSRDAERDAFLLDYKAKGLSYKEIKARGGFHEAESTLRGRYRTLTKPKNQRVRKPAWNDRDILILKQIVSKYLCNPPTTASHQQVTLSSSTRLTARQKLSKISWKQVAESMVDQGCYHYGNATVKKKYMQVMGLQ